MIKKLAIPWQVRIHLFLFVASLLWIIVPAINKAPGELVTRDSLVAASEFLYLVDTKEYAKSWEVTSSALKNMLTQAAWSEEIDRLRSFLGPIVERIHHDIAYTDSASDVPAGEYVIMTFVSRFEFSERVFEKLTLMLGEDNQWQVVGYFLKQA
jgi:hypothetical protein